MMNNETNYRLLNITAAIAGTFSLIVCALLLYDYLRRGNGDPLETQVYQTLKEALSKQPENEDFKSKIRDLDLQLRHEYFRQRAFTLVGAGLLLGGVAIFLVSLKTASTLRRKLPQPQPFSTPQDIESQWTPVARWAVAIVAFALVATAIVLSLTVRSDIPDIHIKSPPPINLSTEGREPGEGQAEGSHNSNSAPIASKTTPATVETPPSEQDYLKSWPCFRGPGGSGTSAYNNIPIEWDVASGKNIRWKTPVPLPGNNSPVVWKDRVFLTGADEKRREVYCFDSASGKLLWQKQAPGTAESTAKVPEVMEATGFAAPTAATDGLRVFAIFANGDLAAYDFNGKLAWSKSLGIPENQYGHASSLATYKNMLIVQFDQGSRDKPPKSKLFAFDSATGKTIWQTDRPVHNSWPSPIVIRAAGRDQIITAADPWVIAYDANDGKEIWRANCLQQDVGPSPAYAAGKVYVANEAPALSAIRADGQGDVTATHIVWKGEENLPDVCSPLASDRFVFLLDSYGTLTCYDAEKGDLLWAEEFEEVCSSSPAMAGKHVYIFLKNGKSWIVEPSRDKCRRIAELELGDECVTSPAFQDGCFYIRGNKNLICIGTKNSKP
jgi:outer membrane protein assembly factor BamB